MIDKEKDPQKLILLIQAEKSKTAEKIKQFRRQKNKIGNSEKMAEREKRTHRLVQHGALAEKYLKLENVDTVTFENRLKTLNDDSQLRETIEYYLDCCNLTPAMLNRFFKALSESPEGERLLKFARSKI